MRIGFAGKRVLITGAAGGLGTALATGFAEAGADLVLADMRPHANDADHGAAAQWLQLDVTKPEDCAAMAEALASDPPDILINAAGVLRKAGVAEATSHEQFHLQMDVNAKGCWNVTHAMLPLILNQRGVVLNIASVLSNATVPGMSGYGASKAAVAHLTRSIAREVAAEGVRVNAIAPGGFKSPMTQGTWTSAEKLAEWENAIPMKRYGTVDDMVPPALFLCSDHASYITGAVLPVDGGYLA